MKNLSYLCTRFRLRHVLNDVIFRNNLQNYKKIMESARIIKKNSPTETLRNFRVGQSRVFKFCEIKYTTLYPSIKRLEKRTSMRFTVTMKGLSDGTLVRREA